MGKGKKGAKERTGAWRGGTDVLDTVRLRGTRRPSPFPSSLGYATANDPKGDSTCSSSAK